MTQPVISNRPLWRLAIERIIQRPLPYILCIVGIALGVAMMVSIDLANGSAQRAFGLSTDAITGKATHQVTAIAPVGIEETVYTRLKRSTHGTTIAPVVEGYVKVAELENQPLQLVGVDLFSEPPFRNYIGWGAESGGWVYAVFDGAGYDRDVSGFGGSVWAETWWGIAFGYWWEVAYCQDCRDDRHG